LDACRVADRYSWATSWLHRHNLRISVDESTLSIGSGNKNLIC
jgi:hypothetical protein